MSIIAHISDLHFGTEDPAVAARLFAELSGAIAERPALVCVSGDLTQRARPHEFRAARAYLDRLPVPYLVVPGNHDVPLYDVLSRLTRPMARYREYMTPELMPVHIGDDIAVVGVNTAHGRTFKDGTISREQVDRIVGLLANQGRRWKAVVAHHPFVVPTGVSPRERVNHADEMLPLLQAGGVEMILTGHLHHAFASDAAGFRSEDHSTIAVHAGTCISTRTRGEPNGYNTITIDGDQVMLVHRVWDGATFVPGAAKIYRRHRDGEIEKTAEATIPVKPVDQAGSSGPAAR